MIDIPVPTIEKPLTAIDYIAVLAQCGDLFTLGKFANAIPLEIANDERFDRAYQDRAAELRQS